MCHSALDGWAQCPIVRTLELLVPKFAKCRIGAKYRRVKKCPLICILQDRGYFWLSAFKRLDHEIKDDALTVVLLDEISWMGRYDDLFADSIKIAWDNMWKKHDRLVLCRLLLRQTDISRQSCHSVDCSACKANVIPPCLVLEFCSTKRRTVSGVKMARNDVAD